MTTGLFKRYRFEIFIVAYGLVIVAMLIWQPFQPDPEPTYQIAMGWAEDNRPGWWIQIGSDGVRYVMHRTFDGSVLEVIGPTGIDLLRVGDIGPALTTEMDK